MSDFQARLRAAGMSAKESATKGVLLDQLAERLNVLRGKACQHSCALFVPGRLEFLGKHTDYAGGRSLTCAIERGICLVAAPRTDAQLHLLDIGRQSELSLPLDPEAEAKRDDWSRYVATVARRLTRDFPTMNCGGDIVFASDLPRASGMSSSSALMIAVFFALAECNSLWQNDNYRRYIPSREILAGYLAAMECGEDFAAFSGGGGVGTFGGSEDQVAILCSRAGVLRQYSYCPTRLEKEVEIPKEYTFVIGVCGVKADKTGNAREAYNRISLAARTILELWRSATGRDDASFADALASSSDARNKLREIIGESEGWDFPPSYFVKRMAQFEEESNEIVPAAADALERGDMERLGVLVNRSQSLAETLLGNQTPETIELARSARALGAVAASAFGAGFGGSVWALMPADRAEEFREAWAGHYRRSFPQRAGASEFFITGAGPGLIQF
jgi:galactokinase